MIDAMGLVAALLLPLWNIPLIVRMRQRKSSKDLSAAWAYGVLACILLMLPAALRSTDQTFKVFAVANAALFSLVVVHVVRYR